MFQSPDEIYVAAIASAMLMLLLITVITIAVIKYQNRYRVHVREIAELKYVYDQELLKAQLEIQERTLHLISQEIHDNVGQILSLAKLNLNTILIHDPTPEHEKISNTKDLVSKAIADLRDLSKNLNRDYITDHSLIQLLQSDMEILKKAGEFNVLFEVIGNEMPISPQRQLITYRIIQEAINNIIKHSGGDRIVVVMHYLPTTLEITITDNGVGCDPNEIMNSGRGAGMHNMQNRARLTGALFVFESEPGRGCVVRLRVPLN
ncbi:MAG: hypothetical protein C0523_07255 [Cytophaga sp.]|nr:hypothetical protein [Cytophaga sp.]